MSKTVDAPRPAYLTKAELIALLASGSADPGLRDDLARLIGETSDDSDPR